MHAGAAIAHAELLGDRDVDAAFGDAAQLAAMRAVEAALARVQGRRGVIPATAAAAIAAALPGIELDPAGLTAGTLASGVVVPPFVAALRAALPPDAAAWLHHGATSQDIVDTAMVLQLQPVLDTLDARLAALTGRLGELARAHRHTAVVARTRFQQATPTSFGLKLAGWRAPLARHRRRLAELRPRLARVQFGGASGNLAALGADGVPVMDALADELGLARAAPWHTQRDGIAELAGWLSLVTGSLGKCAVDLVAMARNEVAELRPGPGGGSSTMPNKANPVLPEAMLTLARMNATLLAGVHGAMVVEHERDGTGWAVEWLSVPQMLAYTGAALRHAQAIFDDLGVFDARMRANLDASGGLVLAEAAAFALAAHLPRPQAAALVKGACRDVVRDGGHLFDRLAALTDAPVDWQALRDGDGALGSADALIERLLDEGA